MEVSSTWRGAGSLGSIATGSPATTCAVAGVGSGSNALLTTVWGPLVTHEQGTWHFPFALGRSNLVAGPASSSPVREGL